LTQGTRIYTVKGGEFNGFQDIKTFPLLCPHPTPGDNDWGLDGATIRETVLHMLI
jgi:hypothetical protein